MRLVFMGTPDFAVPSLEALAESSHEIAAVVTRPDKPRGRGRKMAPTEVKVAAEALGLRVLQPERLRDPAFIDALKAIEADLFVVVAFVILPKVVLDVPPLGSINLHPSLLPKYRGAAPINWAVIQGETVTGISTFRLARKVDAGDLLLQREVPIGEDETAGELYGRMKALGAEVVVETVDGLEAGTLKPTPQTDEGATPAPKLGKEDGQIDWTADAGAIRNRVRGTNPFPGAFTTWKNAPRRGNLKLHAVSVADGNGAPGTVIEADGKTGVVVAAGSGAVRLDAVQPEGKARISGADLVRGYRVAVGETFG